MKCKRAPYRTSFAVMFVGFAVAILCPRATAVDVDCGDLFLDPASVPEGEYPELVISAGGSVVIDAEGDPVVDIHVVPATMLAPIDDYICDDHYSATLEGGTATVTFLREGPYFVRAIRESSLVVDYVVPVGLRGRTCDAGVCKNGKATEIERKPGNIVLVSDKLGFNHTWGATGEVVNGITQARAAILAAYAANNNQPVQVSIDAHGSAGCVDLGQDSFNKANIMEFVDDDGNGATLKDKISKMTIYACSVANGAAGQSFLDQLAAALNTNVKAYTAKNWDTKPNTKWWTAGEEYIATFTPKKIPTVSEWGLVGMALVVLIAGTLVLARRRPGTA